MLGDRARSGVGARGRLRPSVWGAKRPGATHATRSGLLCLYLYFCFYLYLCLCLYLLDFQRHIGQSGHVQKRPNGPGLIEDNTSCPKFCSAGVTTFLGESEPVQKIR